MPTGPLPPSDDYLGDGDRTTGEFQAELNNLQNWARQFQAQLDALSSTTPGEAFNRGVGTDPDELPTNGDLGTASLVNVGTDPGEVPLNSDLGSAAALNYESIQVELNGDFSAGQFLRCTRIGDLVTIQSLGQQLFHISTSLPASLSGVIPGRFLPISGEQASNVYFSNSGAGVVCVAEIRANGSFALEYPLLSGGGSATRTNSLEPISATYWTDRAFT